MTTNPSLVVLVCGNADRADDGAAIKAAGDLFAQRADHLRRVHFVRCGQLDIQHLLDVPAELPLVIVDAAVGVRPGQVVTVPLDDLIDNPRGPVPHSSHALPISQALGVANVLAAHPLRGVLVGIGGADFGHGEQLSPPVRKALPRFVAAIGQAIDQFLPSPLASGRVS